MFIHAYAYFCALLKCQKTKKILAWYRCQVYDRAWWYTHL